MIACICQPLITLQEKHICKWSDSIHSVIPCGIKVIPLAVKIHTVPDMYHLLGFHKSAGYSDFLCKSINSRCVSLTHSRSVKQKVLYRVFLKSIIITNFGKKFSVENKKFFHIRHRFIGTGYNSIYFFVNLRTDFCNFIFVSY